MCVAIFWNSWQPCLRMVCLKTIFQYGEQSQVTWSQTRNVYKQSWTIFQKNKLHSVCMMRSHLPVFHQTKQQFLVFRGLFYPPDEHWLIQTRTIFTFLKVWVFASLPTKILICIFFIKRPLHTFSLIVIKNLLADILVLSRTHTHSPVEMIIYILENLRSLRCWYFSYMTNMIMTRFNYSPP